MGFHSQEYWSGLLFPSPGDLPDPGIEPGSLMSPELQADSLPSEPPGERRGAGGKRTHWESSPSLSFCPLSINTPFNMFQSYWKGG